MWNHKRIGRSFVVLHYCHPREGGAFSRDFTTILAPECRAFSGALKFEKLKTPLIPSPEGAVDTIDWCISMDWHDDDGDEDDDDDDDEAPSASIMSSKYVLSV